MVASPTRKALRSDPGSDAHGGEGDEGRNYRRNYSPAQRVYLDQLEQGDYNAYAGGLLFAPLLARYDSLSTLRQRMDGIKELLLKHLICIAVAQSALALADQRLDKLPAELNFADAHGGEKSRRFDYEKKRFLDGIKVFGYTLKIQLCRMLLTLSKECISDRKKTRGGLTGGSTSVSHRPCKRLAEAHCPLIWGSS